MKGRAILRLRSSSDSPTPAFPLFTPLHPSARDVAVAAMASN